MDGMFENRTSRPHAQAHPPMPPRPACWREALPRHPFQIVFANGFTTQRRSRPTAVPGATRLPRPKAALGGPRVSDHFR